MTNESEKVLPVVGVDYGYLWSRSAENAGDVVEADDEDGDPLGGVRTSSCVDRTHKMGGFSPCFKARAAVKEASQLSAKN